MMITSPPTTRMMPRTSSLTYGMLIFSAKIRIRPITISRTPPPIPIRSPLWTSDGPASSPQRRTRPISLADPGRDRASSVLALLVDAHQVPARIAEPGDPLREVRIEGSDDLGSGRPQLLLGRRRVVDHDGYHDPRV